MIVAFEKNPLKDGTKTKLSDYSNDLENRIEVGIEDSRTWVTELLYEGNVTNPQVISFAGKNVNDYLFLLIETSDAQGYTSRRSIQLYYPRTRSLHMSVLAYVTPTHMKLISHIGGDLEIEEMGAGLTVRRIEGVKQK